MQNKLLLALAALCFTALTQTAQAQAQAQADSSPRSLSRAEVSADLALWRRAGLENLASADGFDLNNPDYQRRLVTYQQWRAGPEFRAEVQLQQGGTMAKAPSATRQN